MLHMMVTNNQMELFCMLLRILTLSGTKLVSSKIYYYEKSVRMHCCFLNGSLTRVFFHEQFRSGPLSIPLTQFRIFTNIRGAIGK